jgi:hypothetical protein
MDPIERSIPAVMITKATPIPNTPYMEVRRNRLNMLLPLRNPPGTSIARKSQRDIKSRVIPSILTFI